MKKRLVSICIIVLVLVLALFVLSACNASSTEYDTELVSNGGFENYTKNSDGKITFDGWQVGGSWTNSSYERRPLSSSESDDAELAEQLGDSYLGITNSKGGAVYIYQSVKVDRKAVYKVSVDIRLQSSITAGKGAFVTFSENADYVFVEQVKADGWKTLTFYVKPINTDYLTIALSLGKEGETSVGTAYYDNVSMMKVDPSAVPEGATVTEFKMSQIARYNQDIGGILFVTFMTLFGVALIVTVFVLVRKTYARSDAFINFDGTAGGTSLIPAGGKSAKGKANKATAVAAPAVWYKNGWFVAGVLVLATFVVRLIFLLTMYGFGGEMTTLVNIAREAAQNGVGDIYANYGTALATMSPGTIYILAIIGAMGQNLTSVGVSVLIRLVGVLADMAVVAMIYFYGRKYASDRIAVLFAALYALLPITFVMSGIAGTFESLLVALMVAAILCLVEKRYIFVYLFMTLAAVLDLRALALAPLAVTYMGYMYYRDDASLKKFGKNRAIIVFGLIGSFVLAYLLTLPVAINHLGENAFYGFKMMINQYANNQIFVDNAFGFYGMVALNQKGFSSAASILNLLFILVLAIYVCSLYFKKRNRQELILLASYMLAMVAVFTLKVTYTYLFLSIALGVIYTMVSGEKRMYGIVGGYGILSFLCVGLLMKNSGYVSAISEGFFVNFETTGADFIIFSIFAVLLTLYYSYVVYNITNTGKVVDIKPLSRPFKEELKEGFQNFVNVFKKD